MGLAYLHKNQFTEATKYLEFASKISNRSTFSQIDLILLYTAKRSMEQAYEVMEELKTKSKEGKYVSSLIMSFALAYLGDIDQAFKSLEKAYDEHDAYLYIMKYYPWVPDKLREDSRFQTFLRKMNFPE